VAEEDSDIGEASPISSLFMELASETRFSIMMSLYKKPSKLSSLSRELNTSVQDVYRNLNRMAAEGLVAKGDGMFRITEYGMMVVSQVPYFTFLKKHQQFFESHSIAKSGVPTKFLRRAGELVECELVGSVTAVFQRLKKLESSANRSLKAMVAQAWPEEGQIFIDRASSGVDVFTITGHNTILPTNVLDTVVASLEKLAAAGFFKPRMIEKVGVAIYLADDEQAALMFPNRGGEVDMTALFTSEDTTFCDWCSDVFEYFWQGAQRSDMKKMKLVE
jgi:predicted transcriptional regulator